MKAAGLAFRQVFPAPVNPGFSTLNPEIERTIDLLRQRLDMQQLATGGWESATLSLTANAVVALYDSQVTADVSCLNRAARWLWDRATQADQPEISELDSAAILAALLHTGHALQSPRTEKAAAAIQDLRDIQAGDGGWFLESAGDAEHLNAYDVSCPETTGRILEVVGRIRIGSDDLTVERALEFLDSAQVADGGWAGQYGRDFLRGSWRVLAGLRSVGVDMQSIPVRRAVSWLKRVQHVGGGWGEALAVEQTGGIAAPNVVQTAWALLALLAAEEWSSLEVEVGTAWLTRELEAEHDLDGLVFGAMVLGRYRRACLEHNVGGIT